MSNRSQENTMDLIGRKTVAVHRSLPHLGTEQYRGDDLHSGRGEGTRPWAAHVVSSKSNEGHGVPWKKARTVLSMKWNTLLPC